MDKTLQIISFYIFFFLIDWDLLTASEIAVNLKGMLWAPSNGWNLFNLRAKGHAKSQKVWANLIHYKRFYTW